MWARANGRLRVRAHSCTREAAQCLCMHVRVGKHACTRWRTCRCASVCVYMHVQCIVLLYYIIIIYAGSVYPYVCGYVCAGVDVRTCMRAYMRTCLRAHECMRART